MEDEKIKILYIEDEPYNRLLIKKIMEPYNYEIDDREDGLSGIEAAKKNKYDLILLDINMEGMNGYEIATRLRSIEHCKNIPLVALTANVLERSKERALIAGCDGFLTKPIDTSRFLPKIKEYLNGKKEMIAPEKITKLMMEHNTELVNHLEKEVRELKRANEELKNIEKLKSDFISIASHELRTPLVTIIGYIGLLLSKRLGELSPQHERVLSVVERNSKRLEKIVKDIFTLSLLEKNISFMEFKKNNILEIVNIVFEDYALILEERELAYKIEAVGNMPNVECDYEKITQVLSNLVNNAIKYTKNGGQIAVYINYPSKKLNNYYDLDSNSYIDIIVEDTGIGIPEDKKNKIFEKFVELTDIEKHHSSETEFMGGGAGLGLPICKGIVKQHGGFILAESKIGEGSEIIVILPLFIENKEFIKSKQKDFFY